MVFSKLLGHKATIERPTFAVNQVGREVITGYTTIATDVACRVSYPLIVSGGGQLHSIESSQTVREFNVVIFFPPDTDIREADRIKSVSADDRVLIEDVDVRHVRKYGGFAGSINHLEVYIERYRSHEEKA